MPFFFNDYYYSEFDSVSCFKVLYRKKDKFATKKAYVPDKIYPSPKTLHMQACDACDKFQVSMFYLFWSGD